MSIRNRPGQRSRVEPWRSCCLVYRKRKSLDRAERPHAVVECAHRIWNTPRIWLVADELQDSEVRLLPVRHDYFDSAWGAAKSASRLDTECERRAGIASIAVLFGRLAGLAVSGWRSDPRRESLREGLRPPHPML